MWRFIFSIFVRVYATVYNVLNPESYASRGLSRGRASWPPVSCSDRAAIRTILEGTTKRSLRERVSVCTRVHAARRKRYVRVRERVAFQSSHVCASVHAPSRSVNQADFRIRHSTVLSPSTCSKIYPPTASWCVDRVPLEWFRNISSRTSGNSSATMATHLVYTSNDPAMGGQVTHAYADGRLA